MEIIDYPEWFPLPQKADKNMTFDTGFRTDQPQVGAPIFQKLTDDIKTVWNVKWIFQLGEERAFQQWLRALIIWTTVQSGSGCRLILVVLDCNHRSFTLLVIQYKRRLMAAW